jgi:hypothetical protein
MMRKAKFGIVHIFIGVVLKVDHGPKAPRKHRLLSASTKVWREHFQSVGPDLRKAEFKKLRTDRLNL